MWFILSIRTNLVFALRSWKVSHQKDLTWGQILTENTVWAIIFLKL